MSGARLREREWCSRTNPQPVESAGRYSGSMAVGVQTDARRGEAARGLSDLRADLPREAARVPELGRDLAEAAAGARRDDRVLRDLVLERPSRRLRARRARDRRPRGRPREGARVRERADRARDHLRPQRDRGAEPRRLRLRARAARSRATSCSRPSSSTTRTSCPGSTSPNRTGAEFRIIPIDDNGDLLLDAVADLENVKVVAANIVSNSLGTIGDTPRLADWAHERGAILTCDAAQAAPHVRLDVQALGADFIAVSGHKMLRAERDRLPLGPHRAAARDGAVPARRPHDPQRSATRRRPGASCRRSSRRAPRRSPRRSGSAPRSTTWRRSGSRRSRRTSTGSPPMRSRRSARSPGSRSTGRRPSGAPGS